MNKIVIVGALIVGAIGGYFARAPDTRADKAALVYASFAMGCTSGAGDISDASGKCRGEALSYTHNFLALPDYSTVPSPRGEDKFMKAVDEAPAIYDPGELVGK